MIGKLYARSRWDGGWHDVADPRTLAMNECYKLENVLPTAVGTGLEGRLGWVEAALTTPQFGDTCVYQYYWPEADKFVIVRYIDGTAGAYHWELLSVDPDGNNKTTLTTSDSATHELPHVRSFGYGANNALFYAYGGQIASYTVAGGAQSPHNVACPTASYLMVRDDQLWACGDPTYPGRVHRCDTLDPTDWTTGNGGLFDVGAEGGTSECSVLQDWAGDIWIFKTGENPSIWICRGEPTHGYALMPYKQNVPNVYRFSFEQTPWGLAFASRGAIWLLRGGGVESVITDISNSIKPVVSDRMGAPQLGEGVMAYCDTFDTLFAKIETSGTGYTANSMLMGRLVGTRFVWAQYKGPQLRCPLSGDKLIALNESLGEQLVSYGLDYKDRTAAVFLADYDDQWRDIVCLVGDQETKLGMPGTRKVVRGFYNDLNVDGSIVGNATASIFLNGSATAITSAVKKGLGDSYDFQKLHVACESIRCEITWDQTNAGMTTDRPSISGSDLQSRSILHEIGYDTVYIRPITRKQEPT